MNRLLGAAGIVGGAVLLAAYVVEIPNNANIVRLVLYFLGSIAVVVGVHRRQVSRPRLSTVVASAAIIANVWYPAWMLLSIGRPIRHDEFGQVYLYAALAWWLADAAFGFVALRLGAVTRWGALALGVGSLLAILGHRRRDRARSRITVQVPVEPLRGKVVIDTNNYYPDRDGHIAELDDESTTISELLQAHLPESTWSRRSTTSTSTTSPRSPAPRAIPNARCSPSRATTQTAKHDSQRSSSTPSGTTLSTSARSPRDGATSATRLPT